MSIYCLTLEEIQKCFVETYGVTKIQLHMRVIQFQHTQKRCCGPTVANALLECGEVLFGTEEFAFKCRLDSPPEHLGICEAMEAFKLKNHRGAFSLNSTEAVELVPMLNLVQARLDYKKLFKLR
eukprot:Gregarina_sp_Poly_1__177@NODE_1040_length_5272_cov_13_452065_g720_i0_p4_GENE_NODE_1040_length_5272_cov_13_452065_g720_i0NODE_1040_length_5272_cov_13_452065_g720_i0_p4_ORF_typecomplete_len124_score16_44_NODE_1040_length_5272_cov_13_452065_g720_i059430